MTAEKGSFYFVDFDGKLCICYMERDRVKVKRVLGYGKKKVKKDPE